MIFNHSKSEICEAIVGSDKETIKEIQLQLLNNPEAFLGETVSESAEWIYDNIEDPNVLAVVSHLVIQYIVKSHAAGGTPPTEDLSKAVGELKELMAKVGLYGP